VSTTSVKALALLLALALLGLSGCSEEPTSAPTTAEFKQERERLKAKMAKKKRAKGKKVAAKGKAKAQPGAKGKSGSDATFAGVTDDYLYDSKGKRDPFRAFRADEEVAEGPRGPLEQFELEQLAVVAVVWETNRPRALIEDPSGGSYVVREGSRVGKNDGMVIHIGDNIVLVKETYVDFAGDQTTKDVELRIRKSQGG